MFKKIVFFVGLFVCNMQLVAQQIPVGQCGFVYIYDANGARVKRVYFCNNGIDPYPVARVAEMPATAKSTNEKNETLVKENTAVFEKVEAVYPNPTTGRFSINFNAPISNANITIVDATGKIVQQLKGNNQRLDIDISSFNAGVYFVRIEENEKIIIQKIVKQ
jgi:Secretion system C-terminal sorting domain